MNFFKISKCRRPVMSAAMKVPYRFNPSGMSISASMYAKQAPFLVGQFHDHRNGLRRLQCRGLKSKTYDALDKYDIDERVVAAVQSIEEFKDMKVTPDTIFCRDMDLDLRHTHLLKAALENEFQVELSIYEVTEMLCVKDVTYFLIEHDLVDSRSRYDKQKERPFRKTFYNLW